MDSSWESSGNIPSLELSSAAQLPDGSTCLASSEDGAYLGLGHAHGLSVWRACPPVCDAEWLQDELEITSIQMTGAAEAAYLLGTVDDMGVARVFAFHNKSIHLLSVVNTMEDINNRSICSTFELSQGGHYGAASFSCNSACWLEIYRFPLKAWVKELAGSQTEDPDSPYVSVKWSLLSMEAKMKPPKISAGQPDVPQTADFLTFCLAQDVDTRHQQRDGQKGKTMETPEGPRRCTQHFLLPCARFHDDCTETSRPELPVAVCLWWSGSHNLLQYELQKASTKKKSTDAPPDVLLPNAKRILCSAVSGCTRYIALGLDDAVVCVWDRKWSPLSVLAVAADGPFFRMHFVDNWPVSADDSQTFNAAQVHLLVTCKSGDIHAVTADRGMQSCSVLLLKRPEDSADLPSVTVLLPFLHCLMLVVQRSGKLHLHDVINNKSVCLLAAPKAHLIASPCKPVFTLNIKQQTLYIRGDQGHSSSSTEINHSRLLLLRFGQCEVLKPYVVTFPHYSHNKTQSFATLEEACNQYLQQRTLSVHERNKAITQTWKQLQERRDDAAS
ncbi:WD repeat-containing protein 93 isoform X2 [Betta splendens]|uniref:WD repeat-containing protein 93 isoform X2 n=1 Tax=Betta splendens TaxID=158456 RepID=A0A6P7M334_BETSP|nr:WD repeat-containing protein 93 isoform X2 [Betta splendens]